VLSVLSVGVAAVAEAMRANSQYYLIQLLQALLILLPLTSKVQCDVNVVLSAAEYYRLTGQ